MRWRGGSSLVFVGTSEFPAYLIEISLPDVLVTLGLIVLLLLFVYLIARSAYLRARRPLLGFSTRRSALVFILFWAALTLVLLWFARPSLSEIAVFSMIGSVFWFFFDAIVVVERKVRDDVVRYVSRFHGLSIQFLAAMLLLVLVVACPIVGRGVAARKIHYLVSTSPRDLVVLRQYGDYWILGTLSADRSKVETEYRVVSVTSSSLDDSSTFRLEPIGPLRVRDSLLEGKRRELAAIASDQRLVLSIATSIRTSRPARGIPRPASAGSARTRPAPGSAGR